MTATATFVLAAPGPNRRTGLSVGWSASLLVHAALLAWLLHAPAPRQAEPAPVARIEVRLAPPALPAQPARPAAEASPATKAAPVAKPAEAAPAAPASPARARQDAPAKAAPPRAPDATAPARTPSPAYMTAPAPASATPDTNEQPAAPAAAADSPASTNDAAAPAVDIASARRAARLIARESSKATVTLPERKLVTDPNADRQVIDPIEAARKPDCKTAYAGAGLLAVIPLVASAVVDTGCKW